MRVLNLCTDDYANYSYYNAEALKSVGIDAESYCFKKHKFNYPNQSDVANYEQMCKLIRDFDIIQFMHPDERMRTVHREAKRLKKKVVAWFTGSKYRQNHVNTNKYWEWADKIIVALPEFVKLSGGDYFGITFDVDSVQPNYKTGEVLTVGHYPSSRETKGSAVIDEIMQGVEGLEYKTGDLLPYDKHMERMHDIDIYIEMMSLTQRRMQYGSYGTTAIEAAALGKIVITNDINAEVYQKEYGATGLFICNSPREISEQLQAFKAMPKSEIIKLKKQSRAWAELKHSYKAQGERLKRILWDIKKS
jgi:hypothetical protein